MPNMTHTLFHTLKQAESFISGFEDDPLQEGILELLTSLRDAIAQTTPAEPDEIVAAREMYADDDIQIDDDAAASRADDGVWVSAWVWVPNEEEDDHRLDNSYDAMIGRAAQEVGF
jgi:hypothetical protein